MLCVAAGLFAGGRAHAQDQSPQIDRIFNWVQTDTPGCAVAVSRNGKVLVNRAYGSADLERDVPIRPDTVFDVGSVVKQFVAAAVLLLVEEGRLSLTDDVRKHIPVLPDYGHRITLDHLLTHTSGLRDWTAIGALAAGDQDALTMILRQHGLNFAPGEEWAYSNSGYVLLKEIVARKSGASFAEFTRRRLFKPLGMKATAYRDDLREVIRNRALAYEKVDGRWKLATRLDNDRGGGGALFSTAADLLIWNDALTQGRLGPFVTEKIQEQARLRNGRKIGYARGLFVDTLRGGIPVVWHSGGAGGYQSLLARFPEQGLSIAILRNSDAGPDGAALARRIFDLFVPDRDSNETEAPAPATSTDPAGVKPELDCRAGLFFSERTGEPLRLTTEGGRLRIAGGPALVPAGQDRFRNPRSVLSFMSGDEFELRFLSPDRFELKSMKNKTTRYRRARPYSPTPDDLKVFAGRYESTEIGAVFQVTPQGDGLAAHLEHSPATRLEFQPVHPDTFQMGRLTVRFRRNRSGKVTALDFSNPLLRNIPFKRLRDRSRGDD